MNKKVLIFGGAGLVGSRFTQLHNKNFEIKTPDVNEVDILNKNQLEIVLKDFQPDVVINFAAFTDVQEAEKQSGDENGLCFQINATGAKNVAEVCKSKNTHLIHISTDYIFDGEKEVAPYTEEDTPNPKNWYGKTKYLGEQAILETECILTLVRISMPFSAHYEIKKDIARFFLEKLENKKEINAIHDEKVTPVLVDDVANALYSLIQKESGGIYHVVSTTWTTPFDFACLIAKTFNLNKSLIKQISLDQFNKEKQAKILKYTWLDSSKFIKEFGEDMLHSTEEAVVIFKNQRD